MRKQFENCDFPSMQQNPDNGLNFQNSEYQFQKSIGVDNKNVNTSYSTLPSYIHGRNQALVTSFDIYEDILNTHIEIHRNKRTISETITNAIKDLNDSKKDFQKHLDIWANSLHLFPKRIAPPILLPKNLPLDGFKPDIKNQILMEIRRLRYLSKKAYEENIPENHFEESHIQKMISMDAYSDEIISQMEVNIEILV